MGNVGRRGEVTLTFRGGNSGSSSSGRLLNEFLNRKGFRPSFVHPLWLGMAPSYRWKRSSVFGESEGLAVVKREENNRFPRRASFEPPCHVDSLCAGGESQEEWQRRRRRGRGIFSPSLLYLAVFFRSWCSSFRHLLGRLHCQWMLPNERQESSYRRYPSPIFTREESSTANALLPSRLLLFWLSSTFRSRPLPLSYVYKGTMEVPGGQAIASGRTLQPRLRCWLRHKRHKRRRDIYSAGRALARKKGKRNLFSDGEDGSWRGDEETPNKYNGTGYLIVSTLYLRSARDYTAASLLLTVASFIRNPTGSFRL